MVARDFWGRPRPDLTPIPAPVTSHQRTLVEPLIATLRQIEGLGKFDYPTSRFVTVPVNYGEYGTNTVVHFPADMDLTDELKRRVARIVRAKLAVTLNVQWNESGLQPTAVFTPPPPPPPDRVSWNDVLDKVRSCSSTAPLVGIASQNESVVADLEADSPHLLVSASTGGGKSALVKFIVAQGLNRGGRTVVLDYKRSSHGWAKNIPGVTYCMEVEHIHDALVNLATEAERRNVASDDPDADIGPRIWIVVEELNATIGKLQKYWARTRDKSDPKPSPAIDALHDILYMGRTAKYTVVAIGQMLTARALGGPEARECFSLRCMTRYSLNAFKMLAPEISPIPKRSNIVGRWAIVKNGECHIVQVPWITDSEAASWAMAGESTGHVIPMQRVTPELVSLSKALVMHPHIAPSIDALRKASQRPGFPDAASKGSSAHYYQISELLKWADR